MDNDREEHPNPAEPGEGDRAENGPAGENGDALVDGEGEPVIGLTLSEYDALQHELETARAEAEKNLDSWQRTVADYNNLRRRTELEREQMHGELVGKIINPFLEILDDLALAIRNRPASGAENSWGEGIELVYRKLLGKLEAVGVTQMEAEGREFDPHFHEAITHEPNEDIESGRIIAVVKPGYLIGDRVLRPAMVRVAV